MSHTKGPWRVMPNHDAGGGVEVRGGDRGPVARVDGGSVWAGLDGSGYRTRDIAKANATLIAAAPDLLEAAERLIELATSSLLDGSAIHTDVNQEFDALAAAVAKARGAS